VKVPYRRFTHKVKNGLWITISQWQLRHREVGWEGSRRQNHEATNRNVIEGLLPWDELAQHNEIL